MDGGGEAKRKDIIVANGREKENEPMGDDIHDIMPSPVSISSAVFMMIG